MKKLLFGLLVLGSLSVFAEEAKVICKDGLADSSSKVSTSLTYELARVAKTGFTRVVSMTTNTIKDIYEKPLLVLCVLVEKTEN